MDEPDVRRFTIETRERGIVVEIDYNEIGILFMTTTGIVVFT